MDITQTDEKTSKNPLNGPKIAKFLDNLLKSSLSLMTIGRMNVSGPPIDPANNAQT
jgi:hypothetical protein